MKALNDLKDFIGTSVKISLLIAGSVCLANIPFSILEGNTNKAIFCISGTVIYFGSYKIWMVLKRKFKR